MFAILQFQDFVLQSQVFQPKAKVLLQSQGFSAQSQVFVLQSQDFRFQSQVFQNSLPAQHYTYENESIPAFCQQNYFTILFSEII